MILNISEAANLAIHALTFLAEHEDLQPASTGRVASELGVSEAHLSKVFQRLSKSGLVRSVRGPRGGFTLAREPAEVSLKQIYESIDGELSRGHSCMLGHRACGLKTCVFGTLLDGVHSRVDDHFSRTTLADLVRDGLSAAGLPQDTAPTN